MFGRKANKGKLVVIQGPYIRLMPAEVSEEFVSSNNLCLPRESLHQCINEVGELYFVANLPQSVAIAGERLKELEQSIVLRNIFQYQRKSDSSIPFWLVIGLMVIAIVAIIRG